MSRPKISVIIPVYNVEVYLEEALMSIVNQSIIDDIEVLMIDDGSTDNSRYIIEKFALDYENFFAYHKNNEGQGIARNYGLELSKGEYVHFMDADDYILHDAYEKFYEIAKSKNYDFVVCNAMRFNRYDCIEELLFKQSFGNLKDNCEFRNINENPYFVWDTGIWNKLYKRDFLIKNDIKFPNKKIFFEDLLFSFKSYICSDSFYYLNEFIYFWRVRENGLSTTQQKTMKTFKDRLEIILEVQDLVNEYDLNEDVKEILYYKWLFHDVMVHLRSFKQIPPQGLDEILNMINLILNFIPYNVKRNLNSYRKIVYKMIKNNDLKGLSYFIPLENELMNNPNFKLDLGNEYLKLINFDNDALKENLNVRKTDIQKIDNNLVIKFKKDLYFLSKNYPHNMEAILIDENNNEFLLDVDENEIFIPIKLIKSIKYFKIKMRYISDLVIKEAYLRHHERDSILLDNVDLEICVEPNGFFSIHVREIDENDITVTDINFVDNEFIFEGVMKNKIENIIIDNITTFMKFEYPIYFGEFNEDGYKFKFKIPYLDIISAPIKKWEIKSSSNFKTIQVSKKFEFFRDYDKVLFLNHRNKIIMADDLYDKFYKLDDLTMYVRETLPKNKNKINELKNKNKKLINKNQQLKKKVDEYKSRKILKIIDKFHNWWHFLISIFR